MQDDSLGYPPGSEQQTTRLEHNLTARRRAACHDSNLPVDVGASDPRPGPDPQDYGVSDGIRTHDIQDHNLAL